jgi:hypothetical protein
MERLKKMTHLGTHAKGRGVVGTVEHIIAKILENTRLYPTKLIISIFVINQQNLHYRFPLVIA